MRLPEPFHCVEHRSLQEALAKRQRTVERRMANKRTTLRKEYISSMLWEVQHMPRDPESHRCAVHHHDQ